MKTYFKKYEERKPKKFHITAEIKQNITFDKTKKQYKYTQDSILDSRVIEAKSEAEAPSPLLHSFTNEDTQFLNTDAKLNRYMCN